MGMSCRAMGERWRERAMRVGEADDKGREPGWEEGCLPLHIGALVYGSVEESGCKPDHSNLERCPQPNLGC